MLDLYRVQFTAGTDVAEQGADGRFRKFDFRFAARQPEFVAAGDKARSQFASQQSQVLIILPVQRQGFLGTVELQGDRSRDTFLLLPRLWGGSLRIWCQM